MTTVAALAALPACAAAIWALLRTPLARRLVALPSADRWHETPTPLLGGIGIFFGFSAGLWLAAAAGAFEPTEALLGIWLGCALIFVSGLVDDLYGLSPIAKLAAQFVAAVVVLATGTQVQLVGNEWVGYAIALVWLVGVTNAFNLLDNMDGLAATLAAIAFGFFAIDAVTAHSSHLDPRVRARGRGGLRRLPALQPAGEGARARVHGRLRQPHARLRARRARARRELARRRDDRRHARAADPDPRRPDPRHRRSSPWCACSRAGRSTRAAATTPRTGSSATASPSGARSLLLALIATGIGLSSLAYNVLDNVRWTIVGVVFTFALLVQFASFLADIERRPLTGRRAGRASARRSPCTGGAWSRCSSTSS